MKLAITICATKLYQYALPEQTEAIQANLFSSGVESGVVVLVTCPEDAERHLDYYRALLGERWEIVHVPLDVVGCHPNYQPDAQRVIARMRTAAHTMARANGVDYCWSLDSDVLPPANALRCMLDMLRFDGGYYSVATCPYPSQGGAGFLFGRGTLHRQIAEDIYEDERTIPKELAKRLKEHRALLLPGNEPEEEWVSMMKALEEEVKQCPPLDNVFGLNAKRWRLRGWGEVAYPAIGRGAIVPTDWCGFGCTLMSREALALADFSGYEGKGTEDLYVVWHRWYPAGLKICAIPHALCSHVIRKDDGYLLVHAYHETEGECVGHIRQRTVPFQPRVIS